LLLRAASVEIRRVIMMRYKCGDKGKEAVS